MNDFLRHKMETYGFRLTSIDSFTGPTGLATSFKWAGILLLIAVEWTNAALANEISNKENKWYNGNTVVLLGENFYSDQVVIVKNPQRFADCGGLSLGFEAARFRTIGYEIV